MTPTMLERYADIFAGLRVDREGDRPRPHKAVMLLSVLALAESGRLADGCIRYSPDLLEIFGRFFQFVRAGNNRCTPFNPFYYLKSDGFWHLHAHPGKEAILTATRAIRGPGQLVALASHASLDEQLMALLADRGAREVLRLALINRYFPSGSENAPGPGR